LESVLTRAEELKFIRTVRGAPGLAVRIKGHEDSVRLALKLTTIARDCPVPELDAFHIQPCSMDAVNQQFDDLGFGVYLRNRVKRWLET
jgi:hypothetical protein